MREFRFESGGRSLLAVEEGAGPVFVMLHGPMADHRAARPFVAALAPRYRVVTPDVRGGGRSHDPGPFSFVQFADDVAALLDALHVDRAAVGGVSGGSSIALRFALQYPRRAGALVLVQPVHAGAEIGYTPAQRAAFAGMDAIASRAGTEGVGVLRPLYERLPPERREKALAMLADFDAASVVATSAFVASGAQPFESANELAALSVPVLLVRGDDPLHPGEVSDLYAEAIPGAEIAPAGLADVAAVIGAFLDGRLRG